MKRPLFNQVTIVGLGLIGGSLGMAVRKGRVARRVIGFARSETTIQQAKARGAVDDGCTELCPEWLSQSDLVVIATPPLTVVRVAKEVARLSRHSFLLTDAASTKKEIVETLERSLPSRISFVGSHPMAGSERSGIESADRHLFEGAACIVTRTPKTRHKASARVSLLWRSIGGRVVVLSPRDHDALVAQVSHVPHLAAAGLVLSAQSPALPLAAGGFADMTRIALGDPSLWDEIFRTNASETTKALDQFLRQMHALKGLVKSGKGGLLEKNLKRAQEKRRKITR